MGQIDISEKTVIMFFKKKALKGVKLSLYEE